MACPRHRQRGRATCPTGGSTAATIAAVAGGGRRQGHPDGRLLRRGHHHDGRRGGPRWRCARRRAPTPRHALVLHRRRRPTSTRPTPPPIHAALRLAADVPRLRRRRRRCARRSARCALALDRPGHARSWSAPTCAPACPAAPTRPPAATAPPRSLVGDDGRRPAARRAHRRRPRPPRSSSTAGGPRATPARRCGRSASARPRYVAARRAGLGRRARSGRARRRPGRPRRRRRHRTPGPSRRSAKKLGVGDRARRRPRRHRRQHRRRPARRCCSPPRSRRPRPGQVIALVVLADGADVAAVPHHRRARRRRPGPAGRRPGRRRRADRLRQVTSRWRGMLAGRAAPPARAGPAVGVGRRPAARTGSSASSGQPSDDGDVHLPPQPGDPTPSRPDGRRRPARSSPSPSTGWPTRPARRSCSRSSTSTAAAGCRSSSPTSTPTRCAIGDRVEMTFRRLFTADGIHNYFWKARPVRARSCDGLARDQGPRRDRRHGLHAASPSTGTRASTTCSLDATGEAFAVGRRRRRTTSTPTGSAPRSRGMSGIALARPLQLEGKPVTRVENYLRHRLRGAAPGRLRGGVGRLRRRDGGRRREGEGLRLPGPQRRSRSRPTAPAARSPRRRCSRWSRPPTPSATASTDDELQGACSPASRRRTTTTAPATRGPSSAGRCRVEPICAMPAVAGDLGVFDCAGVADGAAAAIVVPGRGRPPLHRHAAVREGAVVRRRQRLRASPTRPTTTRRSPRSCACAADAYAQAGITDPRAELAMAEVHDCFTPTELVLMEDLGFCRAGHGVEGGARPAPSTSTATCR